MHETYQEIDRFQSLLRRRVKYTPLIGGETCANQLLRVHPKKLSREALG